MKISVITITRNDGRLLDRNIASVDAQRLPEGVELEQIIVASDDIPRGDIPGRRVLNVEPRGVYSALNTGIANATGDILCNIHGNDFFADDRVIERVSDVFRRSKPDFIYGNVFFVRESEPGRVFRHCSGAGFKPEYFAKGFSPPHPSLFITRRAMTLVGPYKENYLSAADFDMFIRLFCSGDKYRGEYVDGVSVNMECGGFSTTWRSRLFVNTREKYRALRENGIKVSIIKIIGRLFFYIRHKML